MSGRYPLKSIFELPPLRKTCVVRSPRGRRHIERGDLTLLLLVVFGSGLMATCAYGVFHQNWSYCALSFMSPLGLVFPCVWREVQRSKYEQLTGWGRLASAIGAAVPAYVAGQLVTVILALAWQTAQ